MENRLDEDGLSVQLLMGKKDAIEAEIRRNLEFLDSVSLEINKSINGMVCAVWQYVILLFGRTK